MYKDYCIHMVIFFVRNVDIMRSFLFKHDVLHTKISAAGTIQSSLAFFLVDHCGKISTLKEHFVEEEKFNHDLPAPSIPLLCSLSHAD